MSDPAPKLQPLTLGEHYLLRPGTEADHALVRDSWRRSYTAPWSDFARGSSDADAIRAQSKAIGIALASSELLVATAPDDDAQVLGWVCFRRRQWLAHYLYVKSSFRARMLPALGLSGSLGQALFEAAFGPGTRWVYASHVHPVTMRTRLVPRKVGKDKDGRDSFDALHRVPVWSLYGVKVYFSPFLLLDDGGPT